MDDFLLSFRLSEIPTKLKLFKSIKSGDSYLKRTPLIKFLFLTVDNPLWKNLQIQGIILRVITTTYTIIFQGPSTNLFVYDYINIFLDLFFLIDFISAVMYRCKWPKENQLPEKLHSRLSKLVWRNILYKPRGIWMLVIDAISAIPFELLRFVVKMEGAFHAICYTIPALRIYRVFVFYSENMKAIFLRNSAIMELVLKFGGLWLLTSHMFTCFYGWYIKYTNSSVIESAHKAIMFNSNVAFDWYMLVFYIIQFGFENIGFGDIPPVSDGERLLMLIVTLVGFSMLNGYIISALSNALTEKNRGVTTLRLRISLMELELNRRKVPADVIKKVIGFYHSLWTLRKGIGSTDTMLTSLPDSIWGRVYYDIFTPALNSSLLFRSCDEFSKRAIAKVMEIQLYMAGDVILKRNEINSKMFYVRKGTVEIMSYQDDETQIMTFGAGSVFGQVSLLLSLPARSEVHAATFCEIHLLTRKKLFEVLKDYPKAKFIISNVHKNLLLNVLADKLKLKSEDDYRKPENVLSISSFYKVPKEAFKISRNDICVVNTCPYVFEPQTIFLKLWDTLVAIIVVVIGFFYPYCAAFDRKYPTKAEPFIIITDIILFLNIYLSLSTAILKENILFSSLRDIITSRLINISTYIDIVAVLPLHYFITNESRTKPIVLCLRCLELYKIHFLFVRAETSVSLKMVGALRLIKYVLYFLFIGYIVGLIYYLQACYLDPCAPHSWYVDNEASKRADSPIWVSLYNAILIMSGTGYGDVTPKNIRDVGFVTAFCLIGVFLFIYLIAEFSANLSLTREPVQNFLDFVDRVNSFLITHKMSSNEMIRVRQFLNLQWEKNMGYEFNQNSNLFYDTPNHLLAEINQYTKSGGLQNMILFKDMNEEIINAILSRSYRKMLPPHEVVIYAGEVCNTMIIIEEGFCEVTYGKDVSVKKIIGAGQDICTVELMLGLTALCHVRTLTHCTLLKISKAHLAGALVLNPFASSELEKSIADFKKNPILQEVQKTRPVRLHLVVRSSVRKSLYRFRFFRKRGGNKELKDPYLRLGLCQWIGFLLGRATILPYGKLLKVWELSRCLFAFCTAMLFPLLPYFQLEVPALFYVGCFLDVTAWIDVYFRCHVCYYNAKKLLVSHPLWTSSHYIKGSFLLDFIFCFPFDRIMFRPVYDSKGYALISNTPINFLRLLRVLQIYRIPPAVNNFGVDFLSPPSLWRVIVMMVALTAVFLNILTSILVLSCINYKVNRSGSYYCEIRPSVEKHFLRIQENFNFSTDPFILYAVNFYWVSETAFSLGYGDITAETRELMLFVIFVIISSYLYLSYVTVVIASYLSSVNMNLTIYQKRMGHLIKFLKTENVEPLLRKHIINHFENSWKKDKGMKARFVFESFSTALKNDVFLNLYEETLSDVGAFSAIGQSFIRIISSCLHEINFIAGAAIYKSKDIVSEVYIIHQGEVTLVGKNEDETITLGPSQIFGHLDDVPRGLAKESAVATKNVTILSIQTMELYNLMENFISATEENMMTERQKLRKILVDSNTLKTHGSAKKLKQTKNERTFTYLIHKHSKYVLIFYLILSWFSINEVSYNAAFQSYNIAFACILVPVEVLFVFKIYLGFNTGYVDEAGEFVSDHRRIRRRYLRLTRFYMDFFTVIPFEIFALAFKKEDQLYAVSLFRISKYLRVRNIQHFFNLKFDTLSVNMVLLKVIAVTVWTFTLLHQCTCAWYFISCHRTYCPDSVTWKQILDGDFHNTYLNSLYFVVVILTTTGFGDVTPHTVLELCFVDVLTTFAFFQTAIFLGQIISSIHKYFLTKTNYEFEVKGLKTYLYVNDVPSATQDSVLRYIGNLWLNEKGHQIPELLKYGPPYLIHEIKQSTYGHHINDNPVFGACDPFFKKKLINGLQRTVYFPGDVIVNEGEVNETMYFVHSGLVESEDLANAYPNKSYGKNTFFGLVQGVHKKEPHIMTYTAKTYSIILSLKLKSWHFLSEFYPDEIKHIEKETKDNKWV